MIQEQQNTLEEELNGLLKESGEVDWTREAQMHLYFVMRIFQLSGEEMTFGEIYDLCLYPDNAIKKAKAIEVGDDKRKKADRKGVVAYFFNFKESMQSVKDATVARLLRMFAERGLNTY